MTYESLILDIDGTLWDSRALVAEGYNIQLRKEGYDHLCVTADDLTPLFGKILQDIADALLYTIPESDRYDMMARCMKTENQYLYTNPCRIGFPGVVETLEKLSKRYRLFIVSNSEQGYPELCMDKMGIRPYITDHLCYGDTGTSKGKTIRTLMERNGIESAVYVGDTQGDYEATVEAGIPFIWCSFGFGTPEGYFAKIDKFEDLLNL